LFDVGGVLLTNGWDHNERAEIIAEYHLDRAAVDARHAAVFMDWDRGTITMDEYLDATIFYEPRPFSRQEFVTRMLAQSRLQPDGAMGILQQLAASNQCLLGSFNNEGRETNEFRFKKFGLCGLFKVALSSCYLGLRKPEPAIYQRVIDILCRPAERILFIDDRAENVAAGQAAGMKTIQFTGAEALRGELKALDIL
jgi:putative hydrolase of the HAD superfamily